MWTIDKFRVLAFQYINIKFNKVLISDIEEIKIVKFILPEKGSKRT